MVQRFDRSGNEEVNCMNSSITFIGYTATDVDLDERIIVTMQLDTIVFISSKVLPSVCVDDAKCFVS